MNTRKLNCVVHRATVVSTVALSLMVGAVSAQEDPHNSLEEATAIAEQLYLQRQDPLMAALQTVQRTQAADATASTRSGDGAGGFTRASARYAEAVRALGKTPSSATLNAIGLAADHSDANVRLASMSALREGASSESPRSRPLLLARVLITDDPDAEVRREAFEAYSRWGDQDDVLALSQALARTPGPVRDLAVREWIRIETERGQ